MHLYLIQKGHLLQNLVFVAIVVVVVVDDDDGVGVVVAGAAAVATEMLFRVGGKVAG